MAAITTMVVPSGECYGAKAGMVSLHLQWNNCTCGPYLSASEASFSRWGAIQIEIPFTF